MWQNAKWGSGEQLKSTQSSSKEAKQQHSSKEAKTVETDCVTERWRFRFCHVSPKNAPLPKVSEPKKTGSSLARVWGD